MHSEWSVMLTLTDYDDDDCTCTLLAVQVVRNRQMLWKDSWLTLGLLTTLGTSTSEPTHQLSPSYYLGMLDIWDL